MHQRRAVGMPPGLASQGTCVFAYICVVLYHVVADRTEWRKLSARFSFLIHARRIT